MAARDRQPDVTVAGIEETVPVGTKSLFHLHRDSDEVAWVLAGELRERYRWEVVGPNPL